VHQTNCRTNYALGLAKLIFKKWPHADCYKERIPGWVKGRSYSVPGSIDVRGGVPGQRGIINLMGQDAPGKREKAVKKAQEGDGGGAPLSSKQQREQWFAAAVQKIALIPGITSVAFPFQVGCGLAGGDWARYRAALQQLAAAQPGLRVVVYRLPAAKESAFKAGVDRDHKHRRNGGRGRGKGRGRSGGGSHSGRRQRGRGAQRGRGGASHS